MRFGRFAVYFKDTEYELLNTRKIDIVLEILDSFSSGMKDVISEQPDGAIRIIGPIKGRRNYGLVIASPFPPVFEIALRAFRSSLDMNFLGAVPKWIVGLEVADLEDMTDIGIYKVTFLKPVMKFKGFAREIKDASEKARKFLNLRVNKISYKILGALISKKVGLKGNFVIETRNRYTSFIVNYLRYTGIGENLTLGNGDVNVEKNM